MPLTKSDYLKLVRLSMNFGCLSFDSVEYFQHGGLAMGSPLSPVAACLYLEWLEEHRYKEIMGKNVVWVRCVDDVLVVAPSDMNSNNKPNELNAVDP